LLKLKRFNLLGLGLGAIIAVNAVREKVGGKI